MSIKLVFSDIDGTLLNSSHQISKKTRRSVHDLSQKGIPFILVSARMPDGILPLQHELAISDPIICYGGALILGCEKSDGLRNVMLSRPIEPNIIFSIYDLVHKHFPAISVSAYSPDKWFVPEPDNAWITQEQAITGTRTHLLHFADDGMNKDFPAINKVLCMGPPAAIDSLETVLTENGISASFYKSKPSYLEIIAKRAGKSAAAALLMESCHVKREETMAFGDNFNDLDLLRFAGAGIAMGNAPDQVKAGADATTLSNDEDGIPAALEAYGLI
ncbi:MULTISPECIES: Cof-type HAD-IIB family hydrolase [unclassified Sporolactobacillus]|uniref:Cof-type HAD-IIB family hydrolase n=1 Tax=unclassified Sporolactobacillus TaxID=2628533 RepID=UPI0023675BCC|nr:Cof-type HAD-IIB family hydrolase [Sporolactobacillus sp. CQH2019]MDD9149414.1 Cof-type HAD-IIB family hydrolase [Sporolactobacillus sp. CQH2019]